MKCKFRYDMDVNPEALKESELPKVQFRPVNMRGKQNGIAVTRRVLDAYFPAGTIYECPMAWYWVVQGAAEPADEECAKASGMTPEEIEEHVRLYYMTEHIAHEDWGLFKAGVIEGYDDADELHKGYKPGPNWDKYWLAQAELEEESADEEDDDE